jgi:hypothetical protein
MSAAEAQATLEYLVPGFVALKLFYVVGLRTRRSDLSWTVLSVAAAAGLNGVVAFVGVTDFSWRVAWATGLGLVLALVAGWVWRSIRGRPTFRRMKETFDRQAWDALWGEPAWVQVWVREGPVVFGAWRVSADSVETDDLDIYVTSPSWVDRVTGERTPASGSAGIWIAAGDIQLIQLLDSDVKAEAQTATARGSAFDATPRVD